MVQGLHNLKALPGSRKKRKRVGRGNASGRGTYSTRGLKGQRARSGGRSGLKKKGMRRILLSMPKRPGFVSHKARPAVVKLAALVAAFPNNAVVNLKALKTKGLIDKRAVSAKVLSGGAIKKKYTLSGVKVSASARQAIEKAGGIIKQ